MMERVTIVYIGAALGALLAVAWANVAEGAVTGPDRSGVRTIYRSSVRPDDSPTEYPVFNASERRIYLARPSKDERLARLQLVNVEVRFDPYADYAHQSPVGVVDENHHLQRAQRLYHSLNRDGVRVFRARQVKATRASGRKIAPIAIIVKPNAADRHDRMPAVPGPPNSTDPKRGDDKPTAKPAGHAMAAK